VDLFLDQTQLGTCCRTATGTWNTSGAKWEKAATLYVAPGKHTVKLQRDAAFPHVVALRFDGSRPFPEGWKLARPGARTLESPLPVPANSPYSPGEVDIEAFRRALVDLTETFGAEYPQGPAYLARLDELEKAAGQARSAAEKGDAPAREQLKSIQERLVALRREALLANPLMDFDRLLLVKRGNKSPALGLPRNWQSNCSLPRKGYDDSIEVLSPVRPDGELTTLFKPEKGVFVGDVDLDFDAGRMLFSMPGSNDRWQVFEILCDGTGLRQLTGEEPDVDSYDACYLPDGRVLFTSTACFIGVPCVFGSSHVANLYVMDADGRNIRQLCFDQEHDWCPTVMNNGRVLYSRWEYADTPHANTRLLFHMNPDGTGQMEYYGSNSYWPNSIFYARPVPNHPTQVVAVIGGHHDNPRMGELVLFDPALGRRETDGVVQRIPGYGKKVEPIISDGLTRSSWPKFLHPYPLSDKYFLVASKPAPQSEWGIYLADVFDNLVLVKETPGSAMLEPIPLRATPRPPVIPDKVDLASRDAMVYLPDVYAGDGLKGIPRGKVKGLRVFTYHFAYQGMGGLLGVVGMDGPWDIKRVLGTVPVYEDGSAKFRLPANVPVSLQPLDAEGKAVQLMRSWMTAMPGEVVQCAGCHEPQNTAPIRQETIAMGKPPVEIAPWYGPLRGFSYPREVQPVVDRYCVACHDGRPSSEGGASPDLRGDVKIADWAQVTPGRGGDRGGKFSVGYYELSRYVRRPGIESNYHLLTPMEYHADTTELVQLLKKGHHDVELDAEAWNRLITWIDLNCPYHGTWGEEIADPGTQRQRRRELLLKYGGVDDDPEAVPEQEVVSNDREPSPPALLDKPAVAPVACPDWLFDEAEAKQRQAAAGPATSRSVTLGEGVALNLTLIPAGEFVMGSAGGEPDEHPLARVAVRRPFWMGTCEVTNAQYVRFDPSHDSRVESKNTYQFGIHGYPMNRPEQPVVRVSWQEAMAYCRWLSEVTGQQFSLPTEAQWEYACRAGTASPMFFGDLDSDFSPFANLADAKMTEFASDPYTVDTPLKNPAKYDDWIPKDARFNDGSLLSVAPATYRPNAWGLFDMHGNVAEWTRTGYRPYPVAAEDDAADPAGELRKVVRGGSWRDRPLRATSSFRLSYPPYEKVYNVGFRVVCEVPKAAVAANVSAVLPERPNSGKR
jgi:formylglycine-generating enzyme required for sulfatase activity